MSRSKGSVCIAAKLATCTFSERSEVFTAVETSSPVEPLKLAHANLLRAAASILELTAAVQKPFQRRYTPHTPQRVSPAGSFGFNRSRDRFRITLGMAGLPFFLF